MREDLLQYIWQFQYFNTTGLRTSTGERLTIINPGNLNFNQGPDFNDSKIKIGNTTWVGNIEIHVRYSDWKKHKHSADSNYRNVILHVVWQDDSENPDDTGVSIPTLELQNRVSKILLDKYRTLMTSGKFIPCEGQSGGVSFLTLTSWKHRLAVERLSAKSQIILSLLEKSKFHWEETFWKVIASHFGLKVNSLAFLQMAENLPVSVLAKHKNQVHQLEALLFGIAGLLESGFKEKYPVMLKKEFYYLKRKYGLKKIDEPVSFLRMRPGNFPTVRLAQLAMLIHLSEHLFSKIKESSSISKVREMFMLRANDYWNYHYTFDESTAFKEKKIGNQMINTILINTVVPVTFAFGVYHKNEFYKEKALKWLQHINGERNRITKGFGNLGFGNKTAFDSQALIELKNSYCDEKKCLRCAIGNAVLKRGEGKTNPVLSS
jgi:Protein of unknown function (DUF2851)